MKTLDRGGARIAYHVSGDGPPVILGHAIPCDHRMWRAIAPALERGYRVIAIDVRGLGGSTAPGPFSTEDLVDDWIAVLDAEGIERAALIGSSVGGMTAMALAARAPPAGRGARPGRHHRPARAAASAFHEPRAAGHRRPARPGGLVRSEARARSLRRADPARPPRPGRRRPGLGRGHDWKSFLRTLRALAARPSLLERLSAIRSPALVIAGAEDRRMPPVRAEAIAAGIAGATVAVVPEAGHLVALEAPDAVLAEVLPFLDRHWPPRAAQGA